MVLLSLFPVFDPKTVLNSTLNNFFDVVLIGKPIMYITKCSLDFLIALPGRLRTITENESLSPSYKK